MYFLPLGLLGAYFAWRVHGGAYGALDARPPLAETPVAIDFGRTPLLSYDFIF